MVRRKKATFLAALIFSVALLVYPSAASVPPVAAFTYTPTAPIFGQTIIFDASASYDPDGGTIKSYRWDFGDGTGFTIDEPTATKNYGTFGTYNVTLTVTDDEGEKGTTWQIVTVREYPVAVFTYSPVSPVVGQLVTFNASLSTPEGGTITSYSWNFGDSNVTSGNYKIMSHAYAAFGTYNVTLTVTDSESLTDTAWALILVRGYPVAAFTWSPERPLVNQTVTFNASLSTPEGGTITSYRWNFGDGTNGTDEIANHAYATTGNYNVTLTVTDDENLIDTAWAVVTVIKYPEAFFLYTPALPLVNETVNFDASLSTPNGGTIVSYRWDFGDGNITAVIIPTITHVYKTFGTYTVTLTVTDSENLTDTARAYVRVLIAPVADFTHSPIKPIVGQTVTFNASASYDPDRSIVSYRWDFGDGANATSKIVTHAYAEEGTYNVTLTVTDNDGLTDTLLKLITVYTFLYVHDVAVMSVTTSRTVAYQRHIVNITVVAKNEGTAVESFSVTVYYNATSVGTKSVTNLLPGSETTLVFSWNATGVMLGKYVMSARASVVPGETVPDQADNTRVDGWVVIAAVGDVNGDGEIDILDIKLVKLAYSNLIEAPLADLDGNGVINILDLKKMKLIYSGLL